MLSHIWKLIKMSFGCSKEEVVEVYNTLPYGVKRWKEIKTVKNLKSNIMETVAMDLGVEFNKSFVLTAENGVKFVVHIDENGIYNETSGSYLNGNSLMKILDGKYKSEELPWCPKIGELYYTPTLNCCEVIVLTVDRFKNFSSDFLCRLNAGLIFPATNDSDKKEEYRQIAIKKFRSIMGQYGIKGDIK